MATVRNFKFMSGNFKAMGTDDNTNYAHKYVAWSMFIKL